MPCVFRYLISQDFVSYKKWTTELISRQKFCSENALIERQISNLLIKLPYPTYGKIEIKYTITRIMTSFF